MISRSLFTSAGMFSGLAALESRVEPNGFCILKQDKGSFPKIRIDLGLIADTHDFSDGELRVLGFRWFCWVVSFQYDAKARALAVGLHQPYILRPISRGVGGGGW